MKLVLASVNMPKVDTTVDKIVLNVILKLNLRSLVYRYLPNESKFLFTH